MTFLEVVPKLESYWRGIVLFGRNTASYKFALAKTLLGFAGQGQTHIRLEELAVPYAEALTTHLKLADRQATSTSSQFLEGCRAFNRGELDAEGLQALTVRLGFNNVIDAFHVVNQSEIPVRFFEDDRQGRTAGIVLTDDLLALAGREHGLSLPHEVEARWRLVETAWTLNVPNRILAVKHDTALGELFVEDVQRRRVNVTASRHALNGYQKGRCFYCGTTLTIGDAHQTATNVDHVFPWALGDKLTHVNWDGVWNLVLACTGCNRGPGGKFMRAPALKFVERLHRRNEYYVGSKHPLSETIMAQTGRTTGARQAYLQARNNEAVDLLLHTWAPSVEFDGEF